MKMDGEKSHVSDSRRMTADLLKVAFAFGRAKGWTLGVVSLRAHGDSRFLPRLKEGPPDGTFSVRKYDETMSYLSANWPEDATWPPDVRRPSAAVVYDVMQQKVALAASKQPRVRSGRRNADG